MQEIYFKDKRCVISDVQGCPGEMGEGGGQGGQFAPGPRLVRAPKSTIETKKYNIIDAVRWGRGWVPN